MLIYWSLVTSAFSLFQRVKGAISSMNKMLSSCHFSLCLLKTSYSEEGKMGPFNILADWLAELFTHFKFRAKFSKIFVWWIGAVRWPGNTSLSPLPPIEIKKEPINFRNKLHSVDMHSDAHTSYLDDPVSRIQERGGDNLPLCLFFLSFFLP